MIKSMTGYGRAHTEGEGASVNVVVSSVNHRFLDLQLRMPEELGAWESRIRKVVQKFCERGRLNLNIDVERARGGAYQLNRPLLESLFRALEQAKNEFGLRGEVDLVSLLQFPKILQPSSESLDELDGLYDQLDTTLRDALSALVEMRASEGRELAKELAGLLDSISTRLSEIDAEAGALVENARQRMNKRLEELRANIQIDEMRLAQEVLLIAQRSDITEEITRLRSHIEQFRALLDSHESVGKKLDFLLQEMNREGNTILSKTQGLKISRAAVEIRTDIEKLREQAQNVE